jgi:hypothetical protein
VTVRKNQVFENKQLIGIFVRHRVTLSPLLIEELKKAVASGISSFAKRTSAEEKRQPNAYRV